MSAGEAIQCILTLFQVHLFASPPLWRDPTDITFLLKDKTPYKRIVLL